MLNPVYTARAAEKTLLKELFRNAADVARNGGTLVGAPAVKSGVVLNGTSQYGTWAWALGLRRQFAIELEFDPTFAHDDGVLSYLFSTTGDSYRIYKHSTNELVIRFGGTSVGTIVAGVYGAYWLPGERNRLVVSTDGTTTDAWLNGTQILTASAVGWTASTVANLVVGSFDGGGGYFEGTIYKVGFYADTRTQADVDAIESGQLFSYPSRASVWLDMAEATAKAGTIRGTTELMVDGDMEAVGTAAWTQVNNADYSKVAGSPGGVGSQVMRVAHDGVANPAVQQLVLVVGRRYRVRGWGRGDGTAVPRVLGGAGAISWTGLASTGWQYFDVPGVAGATSMNLRATTAIAGWCEFDNISVVETDELLDDTDMEATGVADWTPKDTAALTKVTASPYSGSQALRITGASGDAAGQVAVSTGRTYEYVGYARGDGVSAKPRIVVGSEAWVGTVSTDWQKFSFIHTAASPTVYLWLTGGAGYVEFDQVQIRPVLSRTLDKSPAGHVCLLGDGFTAASIPDFNNPGFLFDGATDYLTLPPDPTGTFTVAWKRRNEDVVFESDLTTWNLIKAAGSFDGLLDYLAWWPFALSPLQQADLGFSWAGGR